ncbi:hypothetical protein B0A49_10483 [Cryomyces minteri]|uniref:RanBD1 domain-containing protein n=1 Tax=Cryomyces minteri TaxID=331657 RepID=A0A4U0WTL8_9PEZI|nr:hypothetical protein B0A49_10483 [Cryomyces minteri]
MSKRRSEMQMGKDGETRESDGAEAGDDTPRRATAAQLARRQIKVARGKTPTRVNHGAVQQAFSNGTLFGASTEQQQIQQPEQQQPFAGFGQRQQTQPQQNGGAPFQTGGGLFQNSFPATTPSQLSGGGGTFQSFPPANGATTPSSQVPQQENVPFWKAPNFGAGAPTPSFNFNGGGDSIPNNPFAGTNDGAITPSDSAPAAPFQFSAPTSTSRPASPFQLPASTSEGGSMFGNFGTTATQSTPSTNVFGLSTTQQSQAASGTFNFLNQSAAQQSQGPSTTFGQTAPQQSKTSNLFSNPTPQQPQTSNIFGKSTPQQSQTTSLFSHATTQQSQNTNPFSQAAVQQLQATANKFPGSSEGARGLLPVNRQTTAQNNQGDSLFVPDRPDANGSGHSVATSNPPAESFSEFLKKHQAQKIVPDGDNKSPHSGFSLRAPSESPEKRKVSQPSVAFAGHSFKEQSDSNLFPNFSAPKPAATDSLTSTSSAKSAVGTFSANPFQSAAPAVSLSTGQHQANPVTEITPQIPVTSATQVKPVKTTSGTVKPQSRVPGSNLNPAQKEQFDMAYANMALNVGLRAHLAHEDPISDWMRIIRYYVAEYDKIWGVTTYAKATNPRSAADVVAASTLAMKNDLSSETTGSKRKVDEELGAATDNKKSKANEIIAYPQLPTANQSSSAPSSKTSNLFQSIVDAPTSSTRQEPSVPATAPATEQSSTSTASAPAKDTPQLQPPKFGMPKLTGTPNFMALFAANAAKTEEEARKKRKAEEFDSDDSEADEAEWERQDAEKERAKRAKVEQIVQNLALPKFVPGKGMTWANEEHKKEASASDTTASGVPASTPVSMPPPSAPTSASEAPPPSQGRSLFDRISHDVNGKPQKDTPTTSGATPATDAPPTAPQANGASSSIAAAQPAKSLFDFSKTTNGGSGSNIFSATPKSGAPTSNLFGSASGSTTPKNGTTSNIFNFGPASGSTTPTNGTTSNLFGSSTPTTAPTSNIFSSNTPAVAPPTNIFGFLNNKSPAGDMTYNRDSPIKFAPSTTPSAPPAGFGFQFGGPSTPTNDAAHSQRGASNSPDENMEDQPLQHFAFAPSNGDSAAPGNSNYLQPPSLGNSVFASAATSRATSPGAGTTEGEASANESGVEGETAEDRVPQRDLTVLTNEELQKYDVVYEAPRVKALMYNSSSDSPTKWDPKGLGPIRILRDKSTGVVSVLMRADPGGKIVINSRLLPNMTPKSSPKNVQLGLTDSKGKLASWNIRFGQDQDAQAFAAAIGHYKPQ